MTLTRAEVDRIIALLEGSRFDRLSLEMDGLKLDLVRSGATPSAPRAAPPPVEIAPPPPPPVARDGLVEVKSPLLGIYYRAPRPGEPPFVEVGARVEPDTIIGIIEVMKLMNTARAGVTGEVVEIVAANGEMVEHGETLLLVRPD
ncbi:acetyl-CoA carboxylase, biotin carboxyl carrier protein [Sphingomonas sp. SUN019]|uniref:acetyl-CoA carboxylase biotin carboxyl carrier protein n=1 Tax=Sphingomonas sp. SUN019 TaxID=2937788 RepID=UPI00216434EC|nr:biotin/lipoyl-containing protein [Sphingomonas sp. SUN019]UVO50658.1 acetyl-CoA carboxylase, biotin carboxyl carrier protein [Sphingomonas sp. SUN019]